MVAITHIMTGPAHGQGSCSGCIAHLRVTVGVRVWVRVRFGVRIRFTLRVSTHHQGQDSGWEHLYCVRRRLRVILGSRVKVRDIRVRFRVEGQYRASRVKVVHRVGVG